MSEQDDETRYLKRLEARARQLSDQVQSEAIPPAFAGLELISSVVTATSIDSERVTAALPVEHWRDEQISIPIAWLTPIVSAWHEHRNSDGQVLFDTALGIRGSQGKSPTIKNQNRQDRDRRLSALVVADYILSALEGQPVSLDAAIAGVAEKERERQRVVERAYKTYGTQFTKGFEPSRPKLPEVLAQASDRKEK